MRLELGVRARGGRWSWTCGGGGLKVEGLDMVGDDELVVEAEVTLQGRPHRAGEASRSAPKPELSRRVLQAGPSIVRVLENVTYTQVASELPWNAALALLRCGALRRLSRSFSCLVSSSLPLATAAPPPLHRATCASSTLDLVSSYNQAFTRSRTLRPSLRQASDGSPHHGIPRRIGGLRTRRGWLLCSYTFSSFSVAWIGPNRVHLERLEPIELLPTVHYVPRFHQRIATLLIGSTGCIATEARDCNGSIAPGRRSDGARVVCSVGLGGGCRGGSARCSSGWPCHRRCSLVVVPEGRQRLAMALAR